MKLQDLINQSGSAAKSYKSLGLANFQQIEISEIAIDSRKITSNTAFFALSGIKQNGADFAFAAAKNGAKAVFISSAKNFAVDEFNQSFPYTALIENDGDELNFSMLLGFLRQIYQPKPSRIYAITGTNGKTSVAEFTRQILEYLGNKAASVGTLGINAANLKNNQLPQFSLTTPDLVSLHQALFLLKKQQIDEVAIEVSSIGLHQNRVAGLDFAVGTFTNFSQDHLDYHGDMQNYFAAKKLLFKKFLPEGAFAVLNADIPEFAELQAICQYRNLRIIDFGFEAKILRIVELNADSLVFAFEGRNFKLEMPVGCNFWAFNVLAALGNVMATQEIRADELADLLLRIENINSAPGRMQKVAELNNGAKIFIDFAHTPEALRNVLLASRQLTTARLLVLFGCGGDRDARKRPLMGKIACELADLVIITDDNPRSESPEEIREQIISGILSCGESSVKKIIEIGNRQKAIKHAIAMLESNDVLILAGKGHEKYQQIGDKKLPFDEAKIVLDVVEANVLKLSSDLK